MVAEQDPKKVGLTRGANKIREFVDKCSADRRKILVGALSTRAEDCDLIRWIERNKWLVKKQRNRVMLLTFLD